VSTQAQRRELGALLRARRGQLVRADFGLPTVGRARATGLRREEVSALSGVSMTWYTWLEQGRDILPSRQVLDSLARTLRLSSTEQTYVLSLVGYSAPASVLDDRLRIAPGHVQRLLDSLAGSPAFAIAPDWGISGWNAAYAALYPNIATATATDRNLLWLVFTDPYVRMLLPQWEQDSRRFLAEFRVEAGLRLGEPAVAALVERLQSTSDSFRAGWTNHDIQGFASRERLFHHPRVGDLCLEHHRLAPSDHPDLHLVIYTPVDDGVTPTRLTTLLDGQSPPDGSAEPSD
jgi:transcriptional regulator with XRE-family HTH domain